MIWSFLARFIAARPDLVDRLIGFAYQRPYEWIHGDDGTLYMMRFWLMPRFMLRRAPQKNPLSPIPKHFVLRFPRLPAMRIHCIVRPDSVQHLHDHPFDFRTLLLRGDYEEEDVFGRMHQRSAGSTRRARAETFHRITRVVQGGTWTLFITGPRFNDWGFLVDGRKVLHSDYLKTASAD